MLNSKHPSTINSKNYEHTNKHVGLRVAIPLQEEGKLVSGKNGRIVVDGPFAESKEAIGGYFYLHVTDIEEAVEIARQCPGLEYGCTVEVRPVADLCTVRARYQGISSGSEQFAGATA